MFQAAALRALVLLLLWLAYTIGFLTGPSHARCVHESFFYITDFCTYDTAPCLYIFYCFRTINLYFCLKLLQYQLY